MRRSFSYLFVVVVVAVVVFLAGAAVFVVAGTGLTAAVDAPVFEVTGVLIVALLTVEARALLTAAGALTALAFTALALTARCCTPGATGCELCGLITPPPIAFALVAPPAYPIAGDAPDANAALPAAPGVKLGKFTS